MTLNIERWHVDENFEPYVEHVAQERKVEYEEIITLSSIMRTTTLSKY